MKTRTILFSFAALLLSYSSLQPNADAQTPNLVDVGTRMVPYNFDEGTRYKDTDRGELWENYLSSTSNLIRTMKFDLEDADVNTASGVYRTGFRKLLLNGRDLSIAKPSAVRRTLHWALALLGVPSEGASYWSQVESDYPGELRDSRDAALMNAISEMALANTIQAIREERAELLPSRFYDQQIQPISKRDQIASMVGRNYSDYYALFSTAVLSPTDECRSLRRLFEMTLVGISDFDTFIRNRDIEELGAMTQMAFDGLNGVCENTSQVTGMMAKLRLSRKRSARISELLSAALSDSK